MESRMLHRLQSKNPDKEYPSNLGQKWTDEEEQLLLEQLAENMEIDLIAQTHNRTKGGINARRKEIAYILYCNNHSMEEIIMKTKLDEDQIVKTINMRNAPKTSQSPKKVKDVITITAANPVSIENELDEIKRDVKELKHIINDLVEMIKAVYEFERTP
jgi:hypothetical protein